MNMEAGNEINSVSGIEEWMTLFEEKDENGYCLD